MALYRKLLSNISYQSINPKFSILCVLRNKWRLQQGLEREPRQFGPLTNLPDYSFLDGRPVPLSQRKMNKVMHQQNLCKKIVNMSEDLDLTIKISEEKKAQEKIYKENIIKNKLKPKGKALLGKTKTQS